MCPRRIRTEASGHMDGLVNSTASFQHPARISSGDESKTARVAASHDDEEAGETSVDIIWPDKAFEFEWQQALSQPGPRTPALQVQVAADASSATAEPADVQREIGHNGFPCPVHGQVAVPRSEAQIGGIKIRSPNRLQRIQINHQPQRAVTRQHLIRSLYLILETYIRSFNRRSQPFRKTR